MQTQRARPERPERGSSIRLEAGKPCVCDVCGASFELRFVFQRQVRGEQAVHVCSQACRVQLEERLGAGPAAADVAVSAPPVPPPAAARGAQPDRHAAAREPMRLAVLNQKGGTGKTTTAVNLASGLAAAGAKVLLVDVDAQGHVGISLGVSGEFNLVHVLGGQKRVTECVVEAAPNLDVLPADHTLASAEIMLSRMDGGRDQVLRQRMAQVRGYDFILFDCGPSLSLLNMNVLTYARELLVPVSCDYLSLMGVRQIVKTVRDINEYLGHPVGIMGVLPTFYDQRNRISDEAVRTLKAYFRELVLEPIRVNTQLKEAPAHQKSIFGHAPDSRGAEDYRRLVNWVMERRTSEGRVQA